MCTADLCCHGVCPCLPKLGFWLTRGSCTQSRLGFPSDGEVLPLRHSPWVSAAMAGRYPSSVAHR